jgi:mannitol-1-phosphate 5-dehydrogenase
MILIDKGYKKIRYIVSMKNKKLLIYGAGAIGRGFLAPIFSKLNYEIFFVDNNPQLVSELKKRSSYKTAFVEGGQYKIIHVEYSGAFLLGEEDSILEKMDMVFSCVGPNNIKDFAFKLKKVKSVVSFENEIESVDNLRKLSGNPNCYFGIPDVISSSSCCSSLLGTDKLCLISENGNIAIEKGNASFPKETPTYSRENLEKYWHCKFYLHNTPHAAVAFLGKLYGLKYIHEAMQIPKIRAIVESIMESIKETLKAKNMVDTKFIDEYAQKELDRFSDKLLFDPISRVSRDPLRKLRSHDRLIQSAKLIKESNQDDRGICLLIAVIVSDALKNYQVDLRELLKEEPTAELILKKICGLNQNDPLFKNILEKTNSFNLNYTRYLASKILQKISR